MKPILERLLNLLAFLLTAERPVPAEEIRMTVAGYEQDSDEAFRRMFERDKDLLRQMGVPLELRPTDAWEVEFGYVVPPERYELPDPALTDEERAALWLAAQVVRLGGQQSAPEAIFKLGGVGMVTGGEPLAADLGMTPDDLATVFQAVAERRHLEFGYRGRPRVLHPYGMVHQRGHWYMVGTEQGAGEVRAFRIDRASELGLGGRPGAFERPPGFRAGDALARAPWEAGEDDVQATVRFSPEVAWWARRQLSDGAEVKEEESGALEAKLTVANQDAFIGWVLGFEDGAEVLDPPELRRLVVERVRGRG
ncbi:MAG: WYL domain-containing protein [Actinomycetota bacterium]|nr:WYL domain-containing protein [Actinomycetota bacterium]